MSALSSNPPAFPRLEPSATEGPADPTPVSPVQPKPYRSPTRIVGDLNQGQSSSEPVALFFDPGEQQTADIIEAVLSPHSSLTTIAADHGTSLHAITSWLTRPDIAARIDGIESVCARRLRAVAVNHLPLAVGAVTNTIRACEYEESHVPAKEFNHFEAKRRTRETMLRASRLLLRFANFQPGALPARLFRPATPSLPSTSPATPTDRESQSREQHAQPAPHFSLRTESVADSHTAPAPSEKPAVRPTAPDTPPPSLVRASDNNIPFASTPSPAAHQAAPQPLSISATPRPHQRGLEIPASKSNFEEAHDTPAASQASHSLSQSPLNTFPRAP